MTSVPFPLFMFPPAYWWRQAASESEGLVSAAGEFRKGSLYNRYRIAAANGPLWLTVPLSGGRLQKGKVQDLRISYSERWQHQHAQTLISAYGNAPYFEALWFLFSPLYERQFPWLQDFNLAALQAAGRALRLSQAWMLSPELPRLVLPAPEPSPYQQVFAARYGFQEQMCILDLIFCKKIL